MKRSMVSYGALSCFIEYCALLLFQKENSKDLVLFMKTETFNVIGKSHKRCFLEVFMIYPFGLLFTMDPYVHFVHSLPPVWCAKTCQVLIWFDSLQLMESSP